MTRIYENAGLRLRLDISIVVLIAVIIFGFWDLSGSFFFAVDDPAGAMFGVLFIGGGIYGINRTLTDNRGFVAAFDADFAAGRGAIMVWRPFRPLRLAIGLAEIAGWRFWVKTGARNARSYYLLASLPSHPRPLYLELPRGVAASAGLRRLAPEAVAEFERDTGVRSAG